MNTYSITALAREQGVSRSTLLYYDHIGLLSPQSRCEANYRYYGEEQRQRLRQICVLRAAGMTLEEIASLLDQPQEQASMLQRQLTQLANQIAQLQTQQKLVIGMLRAVNATPEQSGLDRTLWLSLLQASGMDAAALTRWPNRVVIGSSAALTCPNRTGGKGSTYHCKRRWPRCEP